MLKLFVGRCWEASYHSRSWRCYEAAVGRQVMVILMIRGSDGYVAVIVRMGWEKGR